MPIALGGVAVQSGDIVIGDRDGVVIVPLKQAQMALAKLADVRAAEVRLEAKVKAGLEIPDFFSAIISAGRVEFV